MNAALRQSVYALSEPQASPWQGSYEASGMQKSYGAKDKTFAEQKLSGRDIAEKTQAVICEFPAKVLARAAGCSEQTAKNAKRGYHTFRLDHFFNAAQSVPELTALAFELLGVSKSEADFYARMYHAMKQQKGQL